MNCLACGSELRTVEYQTRAADEAQTAVTSCPMCPVNANKIDLVSLPRPSPRGVTKPIRRRLPPSLPRRSSLRQSAFIISVDIPSSHSFSKIDLNSRHVIQSVAIQRRCISEGSFQYTTAADFSKEGPLEGLCTELASRKQIGMGVRIEAYSVFSVRGGVGSLQVVRGRCEKWQEYQDFPCYIYQTNGEKRRRLLFDMGKSEPSESVCRSIVNYVYSRHMIPTDVQWYFTKDVVSRLLNLSPRAWDASAPPDTGYVFTSKPDGERMWLVRYGSIWYACKPGMRNGFKLWFWCGTPAVESDPVVIDAEYMMSRGFIIIDCLTDSNGKFAPASRNIEWVKHQYALLKQLSKSFPLSIREYFNDFQSALAYSARVMYPVDGVVAIRSDSTEILKIKSVKSMELLASADGLLVTNDGTAVIANPNPFLFAQGTIVEVRFTLGDTPDAIAVLDTFERVDKTRANSNEAVANIIRSAYHSETPDDNERRAALLWCNDIRSAIVRTAVNRQSSKSIVVDIGSGTGQSLDSIPRLETTSYVLIEPDFERCRTLVRRTGAKRILTSPRELMPLIRALKTRSLQFVILNCKLAELLEDTAVSDALFTETRAAICTFSMQYVVSELHELSETYRLPIYGCTYIYDTTDDNGVLIDLSGVRMVKVDNRTATVKWGGDKEYREPATLRRDYAGIGRMLAGNEILKVPSLNLTPAANAICKCVAVLMQ